MPGTTKRWVIAPYNYNLQLKISQEAEISPILAQICINRGMTSPEDVKKFLNISSEQLYSPFAFQPMTQAVACIDDALKNREKILIYGDYDVDGITSTSLLYLYLKRRAAYVGYYIPSRKEEGYGLNEEAIYRAYQENYRLIITVDCGINSIKETDLANSLGIKVIITDHHTPTEILPRAIAVINPKVKENHYPFYDLAGVGVAWKLAQALDTGLGTKENHGTVLLEEYLDLVCLGTIGDVVTLTGENRVIVELGLKKIVSVERLGIKALISVAGLEKKQITSGQVGFILAPRINAAGRLSHANIAVDLLTGSDEQNCFTLAKKLDEENFRRQELEGEIFQQALTLIDETVDLVKDFVIVLASPNWHSGVIGIVSSRLVEKYYRPVVMISIEGDLARGSARSIDQFDIYAAFDHCKEFLVQFGGHKLAAGLKIKTSDIDAFRKAINSYAHQVINRDGMVPIVKIDLELNISGHEQTYMKEIEKLAPFGQGNPYPVFTFHNLKIIEVKAVGSSLSHLKIKFESGGHFLEGIGFNLADHLSWINMGNRVDVAGTLERNQWNGCDKVQLILYDLQPHPVSLFLISETGVTEKKDNTDINIWQKTFSASETYCNIKQSAPLLDFRGMNKREDYLRDLLKKNESCLIYLAFSSQIEKLIAEMTSAGISEKTIAGCYDHERPWQHQLVMKKVEQKILHTVVATRDLYCDIPELFEHVVFFHSPRNLFEFFRFSGLNRFAKQPKIHLLFNRQDIESMEHVLQSDFPDRELLGKIYKLIRCLSAPAKQVSGLKNEILRKLRIDNLGWKKENAFDAWLTIMKELGLLKISVQGNYYCLEFINNGNKCNLEDSFRYRQGLKEKKAFEIWTRMALSPDLKDQIFDLLG